MDNKTIFYTKDLEIRFGGLYALQKINFDIMENETLGLIGPNGSGKTTFFNIITGLYLPTDGDFFFLGDSMRGKEPHEISKKGISRTYQSSRLCLNLSLLDNILIGMYPRQQAGYFTALFKPKKMLTEVKEFTEKAIELLRVFNPELIDKVFKPVGELPQIDRRRVEICRAMAVEPRIILLDEPSAGMTPDETQELMDDIKKVRSNMKDVSIMIIEHDMSVISSVSERVIAINFGKEMTRGS
ncbi:MAG: ATP-binding cassette domain-containing protein, partial [Spirochaetota bacterium]|nr:ATP-binding cassette domain-containing protein [Spirochaetota bacterium]